MDLSGRALVMEDAVPTAGVSRSVLYVQQFRTSAGGRTVTTDLSTDIFTDQSGCVDALCVLTGDPKNHRNNLGKSENRS